MDNTPPKIPRNHDFEFPQLGALNAASKPFVPEFENPEEDQVVAPIIVNPIVAPAAQPALDDDDGPLVADSDFDEDIKEYYPVRPLSYYEEEEIEEEVLPDLAATNSVSLTAVEPKIPDAAISNFFDEPPAAAASPTPQILPTPNYDEIERRRQRALENAKQQREENARLQIAKELQATRELAREKAELAAREEQTRLAAEKITQEQEARREQVRLKVQAELEERKRQEAAEKTTQEQEARREQVRLQAQAELEKRKIQKAVAEKIRQEKLAAEQLKLDEAAAIKAKTESKILSDKRMGEVGINFVTTLYDFLKDCAFTATPNPLNSLKKLETQLTANANVVIAQAIIDHKLLNIEESRKEIKVKLYAVFREVLNGTLNIQEIYDIILKEGICFDLSTAYHCQKLADAIIEVLNFDKKQTIISPQFHKELEGFAVAVKNKFPITHGVIDEVTKTQRFRIDLVAKAQDFRSFLSEKKNEALLQEKSQQGEMLREFCRVGKELNDLEAEIRKKSNIADKPPTNLRSLESYSKKAEELQSLIIKRDTKLIQFFHHSLYIKRIATALQSENFFGRVPDGRITKLTELNNNKASLHKKVKLAREHSSLDKKYIENPQDTVQESITDTLAQFRAVAELKLSASGSAAADLKARMSLITSLENLRDNVVGHDTILVTEYSSILAEEVKADLAKKRLILGPPGADAKIIDHRNIHQTIIDLLAIRAQLIANFAENAPIQNYLHTNFIDPLISSIANHLEAISNYQQIANNEALDQQTLIPLYVALNEVVFANKKRRDFAAKIRKALSSEIAPNETIVRSLGIESKKLAADVITTSNAALAAAISTSLFHYQTNNCEISARDVQNIYLIDVDGKKLNSLTRLQNALETNSNLLHEESIRITDAITANQETPPLVISDNIRPAFSSEDMIDEEIIYLINNRAQFIHNFKTFSDSWKNPLEPGEQADLIFNIAPSMMDILQHLLDNTEKGNEEKVALIRNKITAFTQACSEVKSSSHDNNLRKLYQDTFATTILKIFNDIILLRVEIQADKLRGITKSAASVPPLEQLSRQENQEAKIKACDQVMSIYSTLIQLNKDVQFHRNQFLRYNSSASFMEFGKDIHQRMHIIMTIKSIIDGTTSYPAQAGKASPEQLLSNFLVRVADDLSTQIETLSSKIHDEDYLNIASVNELNLAIIKIRDLHKTCAEANLISAEHNDKLNFAFAHQIKELNISEKSEIYRKTEKTFEVYANQFFHQLVEKNIAHPDLAAIVQNRISFSKKQEFLKEYSQTKPQEINNLVQELDVLNIEFCSLSLDLCQSLYKQTQAGVSFPEFSKIESYDNFMKFGKVFFDIQALSHEHLHPQITTLSSQDLAESQPSSNPIGTPSPRKLSASSAAEITLP